MYLDENLTEQYTKDGLGAYQAQRLAQLYAFGPIVFEVARLMVKWGIFEMLETPMTPGREGRRFSLCRQMPPGIFPDDEHRDP